MAKKEREIIILGTGKVAHQLGLQLSQVGHAISGVWGRTSKKAEHLSKKLKSKQLTSLKNISNEAIVLICVADSAIEKLLNEIPENCKIAYTSGSVRLEDLPTRKYLGVFYPLQTFSHGSKVDISKVPFLIESKNKAFEKELFSLAQSLSKKVKLANSKDRYDIHIAAVMVNNFTNYIYHLADKHLQERELSFDLLKPLMLETVNKLENLTPREAQTGPAVRGDQQIIEKHIASISDEKTKEVYKMLSELITQEMNTK